MKKLPTKLGVAGFGVAVALLVAACGGSGSEDAAAPVTDEATASETADAAITVGETNIGEILVDSEGNSLYAFLADAEGESTCYDECETAWPPLFAEATDGIDADVTNDRLGTTTRLDGSEQVTLDGQPLYYFAGDNVPGETNGQGINDVWFVLDANGALIGAGA